MFGISIFKDPEHFVALALSIFHNKQHSIRELEKLLHRTKNPPISVIYTHEFLKDKSTQEHGLDIIRFISQLSDLSEGYSVSSSLKDVIGESSFLTQIRHNLTHKTMISQQLINISKEMILKQLQQKYWRITLVKYCESFDLKIQKIREHYLRIYDEDVEDTQLLQYLNNKRVVTRHWLVSESTPYEFKEFVLSYIEQFILKSQQRKKQFFAFFGDLSRHKKAIAYCKLIKKFIKLNKDEELAQILGQMLKAEGSDLLKETLIVSQLKKLAFVHYLGHCSKVLKNLSMEVQKYLSDYWMQRQIKINKPQKASLILYRRFQTSDV